MAADRGAYIDQSQSLNLFIESPNIGQLSSMYFYAWKRGVKTTYYLRSRPATRIAKATVEAPNAPSIPSPAREANPHAERGWTPPPPSVESDEKAVSCSLENPETCEACQ
jgi:ribonucleoside-diphosphate reductase alpha chain